MLGVMAAVATPLVQHAFDRSRDRSLQTRAAARVRTDLLARLRAHLAILRVAETRGEIDLERWTVAFDALAARTRDAEVIDVLGPSYHAFATAVHAETIAIESARAAVPGPGPRIASTTEFAGVLAAYDPALRALGDGGS